VKLFSRDTAHIERIAVNRHEKNRLENHSIFNGFYHGFSAAFVMSSFFSPFSPFSRKIPRRGKALPSPVGEIPEIKSGRGGNLPAIVIAGNRDSAFLFDLTG